MNAVTSSLVLVYSTLAGLYLGAVLLRFLLQIAKADFYNPLSQAVFRVTNPAVKILRTLIPNVRGIDMSCLVLALLVEAISICCLYMLATNGGIPDVSSIITWSVAGVLLFITNIYYWSIIATIVMSFVMMFSGVTHPHPILQLIWQLTEPVMAPIRRIIPPMGGLDISPIFIFLAIQLVQGLLVSGFGLAPQLATVIIGY